MSRKQFYKSKVWVKNSKAYVLSKQCICEECGRAVYCDGISAYLPKEKRLRYIVHHKKELSETNYTNDEISLDWSNLKLLCIDCHNRIHNGSGMAIRKGLEFDKFGNIIPINPPSKRIVRNFFKTIALLSKSSQVFF